ncbi:MAG: 30S ribosomal protein S6 [Deltaproteobacteria bacterium]|jgi:small subunit ribosomal protein S6|nr:30S ribosomal protein S6 [Deltaproteobacteria bacterium]
MYFRRYETLILLSPHVNAEQQAVMKTKFEDIIAKGAGQVVRFEDRGRQKLAYPVNKELYGHYILFDYRGQANLSTELERNLKLDEKVFKFLTLTTDKNFSEERYQAALENLANEASRREKEQAQAAAAREEAARAAQEQSQEQPQEQPEEGDRPLASAPHDDAPVDDADNPAEAAD